MNRRKFLKLLGVSPLAAVEKKEKPQRVKPERKLPWTEASADGSVTYSVKIEFDN